MTEPNVTGSGESPEPHPTTGESDRSKVDLEALAERIYRLLQQEARVERERLGGRRTG